MAVGALVPWVVALSGATPAIAFAQPSGATTTYYASADGRDHGQCQANHPCDLERVKEVAAHEAHKGKGDVVVELSDGVYRVSQPLDFRAGDSGVGGHTVTWQAAPDAHPVITGAVPVTGWTLYDADKGIYVADTPAGLDTRQLYVEGVHAPRASIRLTKSDVSLSASGVTLTNPSLSYLSDLPDQGRIEFESLGDFTNRYSPVESIDATTITMTQPAWDNNTWGWDTVQNSFLASPTWYLANSLAFLTNVGEWYLDPSAGKLYYKPGAGVNPNTLDIEMPRLETLVSIGGTYDDPVSGLTFRGIQFSGTSWLGPSSGDGYADQQNGTFLVGSYDYRPDDAFTSCSRGCEMFERARNTWHQEPAAVQVSAASDITFSGNTFTNLGSSALGIGNDANATRSGVGLGASNVQVLANRFFEDSGHAVVVGGVQPDAHHPSDERMVNRDIVIENNTVSGVSVDYKDNGGIFSTYVTRARIVHNEVAYVPYDAIDTGFGWGTNDPSLQPDYVNRGYYKHNPLYDTPTTLKDNLVASNLVHHTKAKFADGGSVYNLSASPGSVVEKNYLYDVSGVALYLDEATRYMTYRENVLQDTSPWVFTNSFGTAHTTDDNLVTQNWFNSGGASTPDAQLHHNQIVDNVRVSGTNWPSEARSVMCDAGVDPQYRTALNGNLFGLTGCPAGSPVDRAYATADASADDAVFAQSGLHFGIAAAGADVWGAGGQHDDQYGAIYRDDAVTSGTTVTASVDHLNDANSWAKSGVMVRNDIAAAGSSGGYAVVAVTRRNGVVFEWDSDGDGYLDSDVRAAVDTYRPIWVRLSRDGTAYTAAYSYDGTNWAPLGSAITLAGAADTQDGGIFSTSHDANRSATNVFSEFSVGSTS